MRGKVQLICLALLMKLSLARSAEPLNLRVALYPAYAPWDHLACEFVVKKAFEHVRAQGHLPAELTLDLSVHRCCSDGQVTRGLAELRFSRNISAMLGVPCSTGTVGMGLLATEWDVPVLSSSAMTPTISDKRPHRYATTARVAETSSAVGASLLEFVQALGWAEVGLVGDSVHSAFLLASIREAFQEPHVHINVELDINSDRLDDKSIDVDMEYLRKNARIIVVALDRVGQTEAEPGLNATAAFLAKAAAHNMTGPGFVYIVPLGLGAFIGANQLDSRLGRYTVLDGQYENLSPEILRQTFVQQRTGRSAETIQPFLRRFGEWSLEEGADDLVPGIRTLYERKDWSLMLTMQSYDMAYLYGVALGKCYWDPQCDPRSGRDMMDKIKLAQFDGQTGRVIMTENFDREVGYRIYALDPKTKTQTQYFAQELYLANRAIEGSNETEQYPARRLVVLEDFPWATGDGKPPPAEPLCGFEGQRCPKSIWLQLGLGLGLGGAALLFLALGALKYRRQTLENDIWSRSWEIRFEELRMLSQAVGSSVRELNSAHTLGSTAHSEVSHAAAKLEGGLVGYIGQAKLASRSVAVKQYPTAGELVLKKRSELLQLKLLKDLHHDNLASFHGLCLGRKGSLLVVWEACRKGSLADILANEEIQLDGTFRGSIVRDVAMGLHYLHQSDVGVHGELTAENCVVDNRWTVKLTDFGVGDVLRPHRLRRAVSLKAFTAEKLLHVAPEALRFWSQEFGISAAPTAEADVYALGMVLYQVLTRRPLYDEEHLSSKELVANLTSGQMADYRPPVPRRLDDDPQGEAAALLLPLMQQCWSGDPAERPKAAYVRKVVATLSGSGQNLVEHMMSVMEKYAGNLETMVATRTTQVQEERRRADELLERMLPVSVARELKAGQPVPPESFLSTTIYFSDIVGFTEISGRSEPLQVVELLSYLYSTFDDIIASHDAYKVETIGDAYMVVSGLPRRNGEEHAAEIGRMALEIRDKVAKMRVPHFPSEHLRVRIGLHSGPCAAGVVGNTMPRYCLFGDTVNTASRMESSGEPMKIQVSEGTKGLLEKVAPDAFKLTFRATITDKGKGEGSTYWLDHPHQEA